MTAIVYIVLMLFFLGALALWLRALYEYRRCTIFSGGAKLAWFVVLILFAPVGGSVAFLAARRNVLRFRRSNPQRLAILLSRHDNTI